MAWQPFDVAIAVVVACTLLLLEGCGTTDGVADDKRKAMQICPAFTFQENGFVSQASAGEPVTVTCPTDYTYQGPDLECSWVDRFCVVAAAGGPIDESQCYNRYNLTLAGHGLQEWPEGLEPKIVPPPKDVNHKSLEVTQTTHTGPLAWVANASGSNSNRSGTASVGTASVGRRLALTLPTVITSDQLECKDEAYTDLDFEKVQVYDGYELDDEFAWSLRYKEIASPNGIKVDLLVTSDRKNISGRPERSGKGSAMGRININASTAVPFRFKFVRTNSQVPVTLKKVFFTFFDVAGGGNDANDKEITVSDISEYFLCDSSSVDVTELENGQYIFGKAQPVDGAAVVEARPVADAASQLSVKDLWLNSLNRTVVVMFRDTSEFTAYVSVTPGVDGRDFEFTGWSEVASIGSKHFVRRGQIADKFAVDATVGFERGGTTGYTTTLLFVCAVVASVAFVVVSLRIGRHSPSHSYSPSCRSDYF